MPVARGFLFSGLHCGIKPFKKDLALIVSEAPCSAAAALTINKAKAAPVEDLVRRVPLSGVRAVLINSGNANALTGPEGLSDVTELCAATAKTLDLEGAGAVLMASTGVIGQRLPKAKIIDALPKLKSGLKAAPELAAEAILTTDTSIKIASRVVRFGRKEGRITAICKGSGMIAPSLASTIAVICTDVAIGPALLQRALVGAMDGSFNNLTVDNDMSTNDAVLALANGQLGNPELTEKDPEFAVFIEQLQSLCVELAKEVAKDGEGATKLLEVRVAGAPSQFIAADIARSVAGSTLVKAAVFGADPNWGRILATVGARCGSQKFDVNPAKAKVTVQGICVFDERPMFDPAIHPPAIANNDANEGPSVPGHQGLRARMRSPEVLVEIDLRCGTASSVGWGCDLSYDYVKINADYTSLLVPTADGSVAKDDRLTNYSPKFKVTLVKEALTYISRFAGKRVVLKLGRQAMGKDSLRASIVEDVNLLRAVGLVPILVHGESPEGTSKGDSHSKEMMVSGQTNTELVTLLNRTGVQAIGLSGMDASFMKGRRMGEGMPGEVVSVNSDLLEMFLQRNYVPVVSPVGFLDDGSTIPLEPDQVASEIAVTGKASKLVYLVGGPGFTESDELLGQINTSTLREKSERGVFNRNLTRKAKWSIAALERGVERVHVIDARTPHSIIAEFFTDQGIGSLVTLG
ncbi:MAG: bifunctional glutamate N-acetyltransferase/amino-acid acetyltransferase ArgJ [Archangium sp.]